MNYEELHDKLETYGVIPVIVIEKEEHAIPLADALIEGGLPVAEITFRTSVAADVIARIHSERPEVLLGAGTLLNHDDLILAKQAGASFGVAPGLNQKIVSEAKRMGFPFIPGVVTPTEIEKALSFKSTILKFFPAAASGGLKTIKALSAPYMHFGVRFMPTGGVTLENMSEYLEFDAVLCLGGTWIAPQDAISKGQWGKIRDNCVKATTKVRIVRS